MNLHSRELRLNSQGEDVALLHNQLLSMGGSIDAAELAMKLFGNTTRRRVVEFQEQTALPPTGVVDEDTATAIDRAAGGAGGTEAGEKSAAVRTNDSIAVPAGRSGSGSTGEPGLADSPLGGQPSHGHPTGLGDLLDTLPAALALTPGQRETLTGRERVVPGFGNEFWGAVEASALTKPQVAALRSTVALAQLCGGDLDLVRALQPRLPAQPDGSLAHLATLTPNDWISIAAQAQPNASMSDVERVAGNLGGAIELQHPSLAFKTKLDAGVVDIRSYPAAKVADFLGAHPDFDLKATAVEPFLIERGLGADLELKTAVLGTQRVLNLGTTQTEAVEVLRAGLTSAQAVFSAGLEPLKRLLVDRVGETRIATLYANSYQVVSATLGVASIVGPAFTGPAIPALASPGVSPALLIRFPSLGAVFGDLSGRTCSHCASVLGPAAYLVDLLNTLSRAGAEGELRQRRPDIAQLELTCENTNSELPYVDLVLEILENAITFPTGAFRLTAGQQHQLDAGTVPVELCSQLAATVSSLDGDITVLGAAKPGGVQDIAFVQGHRRWAARRARERVTIATRDRRGVADANGQDVPDAHRDLVLDALRQGTAAPQLITLLAPEPRLPVSGTPTVAPVRLPWPFAHLREAYRVDVVREVAVTFTPGAPVGVLHLQRLDGTPIESFNVEPGALVQMMAADLSQGRLPQFVANLLPLPVGVKSTETRGSAVS